MGLYPQVKSTELKGMHLLVSNKVQLQQQNAINCSFSVKTNVTNVQQLNYQGKVRDHLVHYKLNRPGNQPNFDLKRG